MTGIISILRLWMMRLLANGGLILILIAEITTSKAAALSPLPRRCH